MTAMRRIRTEYWSQDIDRILGAGILSVTCVVVANFRGGGRVGIVPGDVREGAENEKGKLPRVDMGV
jgi:hypothetical protein